MRTYELVWPGSADEFAEAIRYSIEPVPSSTQHPSGAEGSLVTGRVRGRFVELHVRQRLSTFNSLYPVLQGEIKETDGVAVLRGRFTVALWVRLFLLAWFATFVAFATAPVWLAFLGYRYEDRAIQMQAVAMLIGGLIVVAVRWWFSLPERDLIVLHLENVVNARGHVQSR